MTKRKEVAMYIHGMEKARTRTRTRKRKSTALKRRSISVHVATPDIDLPDSCMEMRVCESEIETGNEERNRVGGG